MQMLAFLIGFNWAYRRARWAAENPPPFPPNYIITETRSTGVPPPPFARHAACPLYHHPNTRCRMCERLTSEGATA